MNKLSEQIILESFLNELEKDAAFGEFVKIIKNVDLVAGGKGGIKAGLKILEKHKDALTTVSKGALKEPVQAVAYGKNVGTLEKFVLKELGNTAHAVNRVTEGVSKERTLGQNAWSAAKNFVNLVKDQVRGSTYKVIPADKAVRTGPGGRQIKGQGLFKNYKLFKRTIAGKTTSGKKKKKKRKAVLPLALAFTPVGFGAATLATGSGKKDETPVSRTTDAIKETAMWTLAPPVAQAKLISDMLK